MTNMIEESNETEVWQTLETEYGLETVAFPGAGPVKGEPETITFCFRQSDGQPTVDIVQKLMSSNSERTRFEAIVVSDGLEDRGFEKIWVDVTKGVAPRSEIYLQMKGVSQPFKIIKPYSL